MKFLGHDSQLSENRIVLDANMRILHEQIALAESSLKEARAIRVRCMSPSEREDSQQQQHAHLRVAMFQEL